MARRDSSNHIGKDASMIPCSFAESNFVLDKPDGTTYDQCEALSVMLGQAAGGLPVVLSCWKLTAEELVEINKTGRVWLTVAGVTMPMAKLDGICPIVRSPEVPG
jgi:hypothetical protein